MMGCALFAYLCANVGVKLYLRQLNQAVVNALEESIDQEVLCEVLVQAVDLKDMHAAVWLIHPAHKLTHSAAARFLSHRTHTQNHSTQSLIIIHILLVCLGGVKVFVILCESERVYACARKILVSVSSLSLPVTFSPLSEISNAMDSSCLRQQHDYL